MAYTTENYINEYKTAYTEIVRNAMEATVAGASETPLERLFTLIDASSADTSIKERLSMKKDAYMQILNSISVQSQQTAIALVDKKFTFEKEIEAVQKELDIQDKKIESLNKDIEVKNQQITASEKEVEVNEAKRQEFLKYGAKEAMTSVSNTMGMMTTAELIPPSGLVDVHRGLIEEVSGLDFSTYTTMQP